jgi:valyl-tRNA synthetase
MTLVLEQAEAVVPLEGMVDFEAERERLRAEIRSCQAFVEQLRKKLDNQAFLDKAPAEVVQRERDKLAANQDRLRRLEEQLSRIS